MTLKFTFLVVSLMLLTQQSVQQTTVDYSAYGPTYEPDDGDPYANIDNPWAAYGITAADMSSYFNGAADDVASNSGNSALMQAILKNSANLTEFNAKCDETISTNLQNKVKYKNTQPVVPTRLDMKFILINLNDINDASGILSVTARIDFRWFDSRLALANRTCSGQTLLVKTADLWFPYFIIQNGATNVFYPDAWTKFPTSLRADGYIEWRVAFKLDLSCDMDFTIFPFDTQYCNILIQSPHYGEGELIYNVTDKTRAVVVFDIGNADHPMWTLLGQTVQFTSSVPGIKFQLSLRSLFAGMSTLFIIKCPFFCKTGKFIYYIWTIAIPVLAVCILTASAFIIPSNGEEKLSTVINGLLSFFLLYLLFITAIPQTSTNIPLLMIFFSIQIVLTTIQVIMCCAILRLLGLEEAEEELDKQAEADGDSDDERAARRPLNPGNSGGHSRTKPMAKFLYEHSSTVGPLPDQERPTSATKLMQRPRKKRLISSALLNEITLGVYLVSVVVTILGFVGAMAQKFRTSPPDTTYYPLKEYVTGE